MYRDVMSGDTHAIARDELRPDENDLKEWLCQTLRQQDIFV